MSNIKTLWNEEWCCENEEKVSWNATSYGCWFRPLIKDLKFYLHLIRAYKRTYVCIPYTDKSANTDQQIHMDLYLFWAMYIQYF